jgi:NTE family protein
VYLHPLRHRGFERRLFTFYGGASLELGNVFGEIGDVRLRELIPAGSLFLGADTLLGPAYVGLGLAEEGERTVFLVLGRVF